MYDTIIVGGGPAGLSAALILGRCRRKALLFNSGQPRNARASAMHGFITRDGIEPAEFINTAREQLNRYSSIQLLDAEVVDANCLENGFEVTLDDERRFSSRTLLLATGVTDNIPLVEGLDALYGQSVHHCPYCDGYEVRDQPIAIYGRGEKGKGMALELRAWSRDLVLCSDGASELGAEDLERLKRNDIQVREEPIARLEGTNGQLERIVFTNGDVLPRRAMFFNTGFRQRCELAERLGCKFNEHGAVETGEYEVTDIPRLYVAGDASRHVQLVIVAASEGAKAAFAINTALLKEDLR
ncbi:MAG: NAD(P)/FAD-dependent oxidoreductase [Acidobacteriota bacterium]|nr:NAD(P)/FAD-dependent oxidoreductase [Acidobacteriota bacterium]